MFLIGIYNVLLFLLLSTFTVNVINTSDSNVQMRLKCKLFLLGL